MPDILLDKKDLLDFSRNFSIKRNYLGDRLFDDVKTENLEAEFYRLSEGASIPKMAQVHALDTEAVIGTRDTLEKVSFEKMLIKEKINQTERTLMLKNRGVAESSLVSYVYDDLANLCEAVKTRTEVAKMQAIAEGKLIIKENNLNFVLDYNVPSDNIKSFTWTDPEHDILSDIEDIISALKLKGQIPTVAVLSTKILAAIKSNKAIQSKIYGLSTVLTRPSTAAINSFFESEYGFRIEVNDAVYRKIDSKGKFKTEYFFPQDRISFLSPTFDGTIGTGLWGVTTEEQELGEYTAESDNQFISCIQWKTPDPVAVWSKAAGLFVPVLPNPSGQFIAKITI